MDDVARVLPDRGKKVWYLAGLKDLQVSLGVQGHITLTLGRGDFEKSEAKMAAEAPLYFRIKSVLVGIEEGHDGGGFAVNRHR